MSEQNITSAWPARVLSPPPVDDLPTRVNTWFTFPLYLPKLEWGRWPMENDTTKMYLYIPDEPWNSLYYAMLPVIQNPENRNRVALGSGFRREFLRIPFDEEVASELVILYHLATYHDVCRVTQQFVAEAFVMHWYHTNRVPGAIPRTVDDINPALRAAFISELNSYAERVLAVEMKPFWTRSGAVHILAASSPLDFTPAIQQVFPGFQPAPSSDSAGSANPVTASRATRSPSPPTLRLALPGQPRER